MAEQNVTDIKLAIVELDGCIFPLNHYRYNFYKNMCKKREIPLTREDFYESLGNMYTMYDKLPLKDALNSATLNQKVEKDLYNYLKLKGQKANDGVLELFEYFHQKGIAIAIITTHKTKNAVAYLKLGDLYNKVDYIIGNDTKLQPLPEPDMLEFLEKKYQVEPSQTLFITSIGSLLNVGNELGMNMIYMEDLKVADDNIKKNTYKVSSSMYETLNDIIFGRYEDYQMYESVLGMEEGMSSQELKDVHTHLKDVYSDDEELMDIVDKTYEHRLSELNEPEEEIIEDVIEEEPEENVEYVEVEEEDVEYIDVDDEDVEYVEVEEDEEEYVEEYVDEEDEEEYVDEEEDEEYVEIEEDDEYEETPTVSLDPEASQELDDVIKKLSENETEEVVEEVEEEVTKPKKKHRVLSKIIDILFTLVLSLVILILGLIVYVSFIDQFQSGFLKTVADIFTAYQSGVNTIFKFIFNGLHSIIGAIPDYQGYMNNGTFSRSAMNLVNVYIVNTIIIAIIEGIIGLFTKEKE